MSNGVKIVLVVIVIVAAIAAIVYFLRPGDVPSDRSEHHVHEQEMGPGDIFAYQVPQKEHHRIRIAIQSGGGVTFGILPTDYGNDVQGTNTYFFDHLQQASCVHVNVTNATFDCPTNPPLLLVFADARPTASDSRDRVHVKIDAYDCTQDCPDLPQQ